MDSQVKYILSQCAQRIYLLKLLQQQGMPRNLLTVVTYSIVISRVLYALPAWWGFLSVELSNKINSYFKRLLQFGYISDRIVVGDLLDDADHDLFRKACHSHHWILCYHRNVFLLIYEYALVILSSYPITLHCWIKSHLLWESYISMFYLLATDLLVFECDCDFFISFFLINVAFVCALSHE